jgi:hypothetical protein
MVERFKNRQVRSAKKAKETGSNYQKPARGKMQKLKVKT